MWVKVTLSIIFFRRNKKMIDCNKEEKAKSYMTVAYILVLFDRGMGKCVKD